MLHTFHWEGRERVAASEGIQFQGPKEKLKPAMDKGGVELIYATCVAYAIVELSWGARVGATLKEFPLIQD